MQGPGSCRRSGAGEGSSRTATSLSLSLYLSLSLSVYVCLSLSLSLYISLYIYIHLYIYIYIHVQIHSTISLSLSLSLYISLSLSLYNIRPQEEEPGLSSDRSRKLSGPKSLSTSRTSVSTTPSRPPGGSLSRGRGLRMPWPRRTASPGSPMGGRAELASLRPSPGTSPGGGWR